MKHFVDNSGWHQEIVGPGPRPPRQRVPRPGIELIRAIEKIAKHGKGLPKNWRSRIIRG